METGGIGDDLDAGRRRRSRERLCIVTRTVRPTDRLIRFVAGPDGITPDLKRRLPGRGVWVTATRAAIALAVRQRAFARSFKRDVRVAPDLDAVVERLLERAALDALSIAHKAGAVVTGFAKVEAALNEAPVVAVLHAAEAGADGVRKLDAAAYRRFGPRAAPPAFRIFAAAQLDLALGRASVVHAAVLAGPASKGFLARVRALDRYRSDGRDAGDGSARARHGGS